MRSILIILIVIGLLNSAGAQDFANSAQTAKQSYSSGNLENTRFALQQMLQSIDLVSAKEVLKVLPETFGAMSAQSAADQISLGTGFAGVVIHREYLSGDKAASMEIISNSPLISSLNAMLAMPFIGAGNNGERMVIKIDGYKALIQKGLEDQKVTYDVQIPLGSTLITLKTENFTDDIQKLVSAIPVAKVSQTLN